MARARESTLLGLEPTVAWIDWRQGKIRPASLCCLQLRERRHSPNAEQTVRYASCSPRRGNVWQQALAEAGAVRCDLERCVAHRRKLRSPLHSALAIFRAHNCNYLRIQKALRESSDSFHRPLGTSFYFILKLGTDY